MSSNVDSRTQSNDTKKTHSKGVIVYGHGLIIVVTLVQQPLQFLLGINPRDNHYVKNVTDHFQQSMTPHNGPMVHSQNSIGHEIGRQNLQYNPKGGRKKQRVSRGVHVHCVVRNTALLFAPHVLKMSWWWWWWCDFEPDIHLVESFHLANLPKWIRGSLFLRLHHDCYRANCKIREWIHRIHTAIGHEELPV